MRLWSTFLSTAAVLSGMLVPAPARADEKLEFFEKHIRPVLVEHCYKCHSAKSKSVKGALLLDSRDGLLKGGESGPALVPGKPGESLILAAMRHESLEMPPAKKLPAAVITNFVRWIRAGAVDPRTGRADGGSVQQSKSIDWDKARQFWAFQPVRRWPAPKIEKKGWARNPIDHFVLARLEAAHLTPQRAADRLTLLRRATFDLTGLPPTPQEVMAFQNDTRVDAYELLIDRLLGSPAYGERWGRHWLDVARYADSNGSDENLNLPNAWRYRDYVIDALNRDLSYADFLREQLAGDLLPSTNDADRHRRWTATGFLVLGSKMLAEQDKVKMFADIVDEQIDTLSQAFLGLTIGCARCHDHKFDPIPTTDYYALAGILHSTKSMANQDFVSKWNERYLVSEEMRQRIRAENKRIDDLNKRRNQLRDKLNASSKSSPDRAGIEAEKKRIEEQVKKLQEQLPKYPAAMAVGEGAARDVPVHIRGSHLSLTKAATPRGVLTVTRTRLAPPKIPDKSSGRLELANWLTDPRHPLTARVMVNRIWQGHFGLGLTGSPNNFGTRGQLPTHPKLLDWLASEFVTNDWSVKHLHRLIMTSAAYRMSSRFDAKSVEKDPSNRLLWRQRRRRLEVEPIRDAILAVGGSLDQRIGGSLSGDATPNYQRLKKDVFGSYRRAVYLPINRSALYEMFAIFDYADASVSIGRRPTTVVSHQALFMMNNPMVLEQTRLLTKRVIRQEETVVRRLRRLYMTLYGRPPTAQETNVARRYLATAAPLTSSEDRQLESWLSLCRVLIAANEFIYVD